MCGLAGILPFGSVNPDRIVDACRLMTSTLSHRGPDESDIWFDPASGLALGHTRLAVLELSDAGHQPMLSADGRYVLVFNGEIYNHLEIRRELLECTSSLPPWKGHSDTETLLAAIQIWGLESTLLRIRGMFAIALWDRLEAVLQLARDRLGEKPIYWGFSGSGSDRVLLFSSEPASLRAWPGFTNPINRSALAQLLRFGALSAPSTIYQGIQQLLPGHIVNIQLLYPSEFPRSRPWWCFRSLVKSSIAEPFTDSHEGLEALEVALSNSVREQSLSDVPLGSFLSGGIDSSLITALLQAQSARPVSTFTIGFEESGFNEAPFARAVASHLGTDHTERILTAADAQALIPQLPRLYSEPFADASQLPTHLVCREARRSGLTVALSGDGGDELFGGYNRYFWGPRIWNRLGWLPSSLRCSLGLLIRSISPACWDFIGQSMPIHQLGHKAHKLSDRLVHVRSLDDLYLSLVSEWRNPASLLQPHGDDSLIQESSSPLDWLLPDELNGDSVARMMVKDTLNYLPNDILTKVDRAAMGASLETRSPFLDHRVVEVAWRLPMALKIRPGKGGGTSKFALRQILYKYVPPSLIERPKAGFGMPVGQWLRGPLRPWAEDLLDPSVIQSQGYLRSKPIQTLWHQHLSGRFDHTTRLWTVLMWQAWLAEWV